MYVKVETLNQKFSLHFVELLERDLHDLGVSGVVVEEVGSSLHDHEQAGSKES